jgi:pimeloyl-ACP methyl ester carboxylesterase
VTDWTERDWASLVHDVEIGGRTLRYVDAGCGEPVIFVHGLGGSWQNWLLNMHELSAERRTIAVDLPGFGQSERLGMRYTIGELARVLGALGRRLCDGPIDFVGHSMGALVCAELAVVTPGAARRLVLVAPARRSHALMAAARINHAIGSRLGPSPDRVARRPKTRRRALRGTIRAPERIPAALAWELRAGGAAATAFAPATRAIAACDVRSRAGTIGVPVLLARGRHDPFVSLRDLHAWRTALPDARTVVFDTPAHMPQIEEPESFDRVVATFLAGSDDVAVQRALLGASSAC